MSISESSFGTRLEKAKQLQAHLTTYTGYKPPTPAESAEKFGLFLLSIDKQNADTAVKAHAYSAAVEDRQNKFYKGDNSLKKVVLGINRTVRACFGRDSKEAADMQTMVNKIKEVKRKKVPNHLQIHLR